MVKRMAEKLQCGFPNFVYVYNCTTFGVAIFLKCGLNLTPQMAFGKLCFEEAAMGKLHFSTSHGSAWMPERYDLIF